MENNTPKKKSACYCRVSTKDDDQVNSFESQQKFFERFFKYREDRELYKIYADRGLSGTKLYRPQFDMMLQDAGLQRVTDKETNQKIDTYKIVGAPKFDYIYVTNISRFARNISADALIKTLAINKVYLVYIDADEDERSTETEAGQRDIINLLVASEEYSRDVSSKVRAGQKRAFAEGKIQSCYRIYGYKYIPLDKSRPDGGNCLEIIEEEAKVIRMIFDYYVNEQIGTETIVRRLGEQGYFTRANKRFASNTILSMLENEKYCGGNNSFHVSTGKVFSDRRHREIDYNNKTRREARDATEEQIKNGIVKIPPIISRELWEKAQEIRAGRVTPAKKGIYHGNSDYAGLIKCGVCGGRFDANGTSKRKDGSLYRLYACEHRYRYDTEHGIPRCECQRVSNITLDKYFEPGTYQIYLSIYYSNLLKQCKEYKEQLKAGFDNGNKAKAKSIQKLLEKNKQSEDKLLDLYMSDGCTKEQYQTRHDKLKQEEEELKNEYSQATMNNDAITASLNELQEIVEEATRQKKELMLSLADLESKQGKKKDTRSAEQIEKDKQQAKKELLFQVESIIIPAQGEPYIEFKTDTKLRALYDKLKSLKAQ